MTGTIIIVELSAGVHLAKNLMAFAFSVGSGGEGSSSDERTGKAIANYVEHNGTKYVVDGHYRLSVAKKLILKEVPIEQVKLPYKGYKTVEDLLWFH